MDHIVSIVSLGTKTLGRCYYETVYRVTSTRPLTQDEVQSLKDEGKLGYGQEFFEESCSTSEGLTVTNYVRRVDSGD